MKVAEFGDRAVLISDFERNNMFELTAHLSNEFSNFEVRNAMETILVTAPKPANFLQELVSLSANLFAWQFSSGS